MEGSSVLEGQAAVCLGTPRDRWLWPLWSGLGVLVTLHPMEVTFSCQFWKVWLWFWDNDWGNSCCYCFISHYYFTFPALNFLLFAASPARYSFQERPMWLPHFSNRLRKPPYFPQANVANSHLYCINMFRLVRKTDTRISLILHANAISKNNCAKCPKY